MPNSHLALSHISGDIDNVYYDVRLVNDTLDRQPIRINDNRSNAIIANPGDFEVSVIRFDIPTNDIPLFYATPQPNQGDANVLTQSVTIENGATTAQDTQFLIYVPQNTFAAPTVNPDGTWTPNDPYHRIFYYQDWLDIINKAISTAYGMAGLVGTPPQFRYDPVIELFSVVFEASFLDSAVTPNRLFLSLGLDLQFNTLPIFADRTSNTLYARVRVRDTGNNVLAGPLYEMKQDYRSLSGFNAFQQVVITTGSMPISAEIVSGPLNSSGNNSSNDNSLKIITDFSVDKDINNRGVLQYLPSAEYRMIDITSSSPLFTIELQAFWVDYNGNFFPIEISPEFSAEFKILFRRKK